MHFWQVQTLFFGGISSPVKNFFIGAMPEFIRRPTRIRLVSTTDSADKSVYTEVVIPTDIIDAAQPATEVRSVAIERFL